MSSRVFCTFGPACHFCKKGTCRNRPAAAAAAAAAPVIARCQKGRTCYFRTIGTCHFSHAQDDAEEEEEAKQAQYDNTEALQHPTFALLAHYNDEIPEEDPAKQCSREVLQNRELMLYWANQVLERDDWHVGCTQLAHITWSEDELHFFRTVAMNLLAQADADAEQEEDEEAHPGPEFAFGYELGLAVPL